MHMADALLAPAVAATMYAASVTTTGVSVYQLKKDENTMKLPTMAVSAAMVFAGQMVNYTIPGTGSSGHLCGGMMLSALLGPQAGFLSMVVILLIQCLFFADGGIMALGANCWNMAFYGCFVGYYLIWKPILRSKLFSKFGANRATRLKIILATVLGCIITLQMGAFSVVVETSLSGITELPFATFCGIMQPIHLAIGLVEGLISSAVLVFVYEARPEMIQETQESALNRSPKATEGKISPVKTIILIAVLTVITGGLLSHFASSNPDGLEWSLFGNEEAGYNANMGLDEENYGYHGDWTKKASDIQEKTAFLPDYAFADSDNPAGTTVSGLLGSAMVAVVAVLVCFVGKFFRKKQV